MFVYHVHSGAHSGRGGERAPELELQVVVSSPMRLLGTKPHGVLNCRDTFGASLPCFGGICFALALVWVWGPESHNVVWAGLRLTV